MELQLCQPVGEIVDRGFPWKGIWSVRSRCIDWCWVAAAETSRLRSSASGSETSSSVGDVLPLSADLSWRAPIPWPVFGRARSPEFLPYAKLHTHGIDQRHGFRSRLLGSDVAADWGGLAAFQSALSIGALVWAVSLWPHFRSPLDGAGMLGDHGCPHHVP